LFQGWSARKGLQPLVLEEHTEKQTQTVFFPVFSDPTAEDPWFGLRAMRNRPPTLVEASRQDR
jgi:hypothetical protein